MTIADIKKTTETKMEQSIAAFKNNLTAFARTCQPGFARHHPC
jgi:ribosome recycling factor